jgi:hypothetical protein
MCHTRIGRDDFGFRSFGGAAGRLHRERRPRSATELPLKLPSVLFLKPTHASQLPSLHTLTPSHTTHFRVTSTQPVPSVSPFRAGRSNSPTKPLRSFARRLHSSTRTATEMSVVSRASSTSGGGGCGCGGGDDVDPDTVCAVTAIAEWRACQKPPKRAFP